MLYMLAIEGQSVLPYCDWETHALWGFPNCDREVVGQPIER